MARDDNRNAVDEVTLILPYKAVILGTTITIVLVGLYIWFFYSTIKIEVLLNIVTAGITGTAVVYAAINVRLIYENSRHDIDRKAKEFSLHLIERWQGPQMAAQTTTCYVLRSEIREKGLDPKNITDLLKSNKEIQVAVVAVLNFLENLSISLDHGVADEKVLKSFFKTIVIGYGHSFGDFVKLKRREAQSERVLINFTRLAEAWQNE